MLKNPAALADIVTSRFTVPSDDTATVAVANTVVAVASVTLHSIFLEAVGLNTGNAKIAAVAPAITTPSFFQEYVGVVKPTAVAVMFISAGNIFIKLGVLVVSATDLEVTIDIRFTLRAIDCNESLATHLITRAAVGANFGTAKVGESVPAGAPSTVHTYVGVTENPYGVAVTVIEAGLESTKEAALVVSCRSLNVFVDIDIIVILRARVRKESLTVQVTTLAAVGAKEGTLKVCEFVPTATPSNFQAYVVPAPNP